VEAVGATRRPQAIKSELVWYHGSMASMRSKTLRYALNLSRLLSQPISSKNLQAKRASYAKLAVLFPVPRNVKITPLHAPGVKGEWLVAPGARPGKVLMYFHGGGFVFDSLKVHRELIARIAAAGNIRALSVGYSLAPEHPFPAAVNEALTAYKWLLQTTPASDIVVGGDSAGGSIALSLLHLIRAEHLPFPKAVVAICPATDAANVAAEMDARRSNEFFDRRGNLDFFIDSYFQKTSRSHPVASPIHGDLAGFPPLLIHVDKDELMYKAAHRFVDKARAAGVDVTFYEVRGLWHTWHLFATYIPEARAAIDQIGKFIISSTT
jgi:monoterpene epsilon-lactone hydrolase